MKKTEQIRRQVFYAAVVFIVAESKGLEEFVTDKQFAVIKTMKDILSIRVADGDVFSAHKKFDALVNQGNLLVSLEAEPICVSGDSLLADLWFALTGLKPVEVTADTEGAIGTVSSLRQAAQEKIWDWIETKHEFVESKTFKMIAEDCVPEELQELP